MSTTAGTPNGASNLGPTSTRASTDRKTLRRESNDRLLIQAMDALIEGRAARTNGDLTATNVALEAGLGRASLYRRPALLALWTERVRALRSTPEAVAPPQEEVRRLREELARVRQDAAARVRALESANDVLAQQVQYLSLALADARDSAPARVRAIDAPRTRGGQTGRS